MQSHQGHQQEQEYAKTFNMHIILTHIEAKIGTDTQNRKIKFSHASK